MAAPNNYIPVPNGDDESLIGLSVGVDKTSATYLGVSIGLAIALGIILGVLVSLGVFHRVLTD